MVDVSRALMGLGAAIGGQAPQFRQQMMLEDEAARQRALQDEQAAEKRRQTLFQDAAVASSLLDQGDIGSVVRLMEDRYNILSQIPNVDTSHTRRYLDLARAASTGDVRALNALQTEMNNAVTAGRAYNQISVDQSMPASFRALQMQAQAAGLKAGTPEYEEFMRYGGASGQMGAAKTTTYKNGVVVKIPRIGPPEVYGRDGQMVLDPEQKRSILDEAIQSGIAYEGDVATARERSTLAEQDAREVLNTGIRQARNIGRLRSALDVLDQVETGGLATLSLRTKRALGLTDANEALLAYTLRKNVLQQLRPTFGAAFTAREGDLLASIEANESQSTEANRALLEEMIREMELDIDRARTLAPDMGVSGERALQDIRGYMNQNFYTGSNGETQGGASVSGPITITFDAQGNRTNGR